MNTGFWENVSPDYSLCECPKQDSFARGTIDLSAYKHEKEIELSRSLHPGLGFSKKIWRLLFRIAYSGMLWVEKRAEIGRHRLFSKIFFKVLSMVDRLKKTVWKISSHDFVRPGQKVAKSTKTSHNDPSIETAKISYFRLSVSGTLHLREITASC